MDPGESERSHSLSIPLKASSSTDANFPKHQNFAPICQTPKNS